MPLTARVDSINGVGAALGVYERLPRRCTLHNSTSTYAGVRGDTIYRGIKRRHNAFITCTIELVIHSLTDPKDVRKKGGEEGLLKSFDYLKPFRL